jgi:hypothetical protein
LSARQAYQRQQQQCDHHHHHHQDGRNSSSSSSRQCTATMATPDNAGCIVWALGMSFFFTFITLFFTDEIFYYEYDDGCPFLLQVQEGLFIFKLQSCTSSVV